MAYRHAEAARLVVTTILPLILRTGRRPVIFSRYSGIGDIICTFPAAHALKKRHPESEFIYNCHAESAPLVRMAGVTSHFTFSRHIGLIGHWYRFLLAGFYHFGYRDEFTDSASSDNLVLEFAQQYDVEVEDAHPKLQCNPAVRQRVGALVQELREDGGPLILLHPGPSWPVREWPNEYWCQLVECFRARGYVNIFRLGVGRHLTFGEVPIEDIPLVKSLVGQLTLEESAGIIALGDLFVGIDSGLLHIAASMRTPSVGLWGATSHQLRFSEIASRNFVTAQVQCQGCHHRVPRLHWETNCPSEIACMKSISVDEVLHACLEELNSQNARVRDSKADDHGK